MREHGVLNRVLLICEEGACRLRTKEDIPPEGFRSTATLVREFVEDYHERLEERFSRAEVVTPLVALIRSTEL
jgi:hemerythrin-like domain-containing protein